MLCLYEQKRSAGTAAFAKWCIHLEEPDSVPEDHLNVKMKAQPTLIQAVTMVERSVESSCIEPDRRTGGKRLACDR